MENLPKIPSQPITQDQLKWIIAQVDRAADQKSNSRLRTYRNQSIVGFLGLLFGLIIAIHGNSQAIHNATQKSREARGVVCRIIKQGDLSLYRYYHERTISHTQLERGLRESQHARQELAPATNCDTNFTRPPT